MSEEPQKDEEDDGGWNPGPELVSVDHLVAESGDSEGADGDNDDSSRTLNIVVDCLDELSTHDGVDRGPADTGQNVEERNYSQIVSKAHWIGVTNVLSLTPYHPNQNRESTIWRLQAVLVSRAQHNVTFRRTYNPNFGPNVEK